MKLTRAKILLALCVLCQTSPASAQEWTRFRGPNGTGISHAKTIPTKLTAAEINWKVELPGVGHSSPVLWGERVFVTTTGDKAGGFQAVCVDARAGKILWQHDFALTPFHRHKLNSYASATPTVNAERVYVTWNDPEHYQMAALDHAGKLVWQRDFGPYVSQHGCGPSPILYRGMVILGNEQDDEKFVKGATRSGTSFVIAVDAKTGATAWQTARRSAVVSYSTPCVFEPKNGATALLFASQAHGLYALEPSTGKVLWEYDQAFTMRSCSSPMIAGELILGSCGSGGGGHYVTAVKPGDALAKKPAELAYQMKKSAPYVPTGIVGGDLVWLWSDGGMLTCLHAPTGDVRFQERVGGNFFGSPVWIDGRLFAVSTAGELVVVEASEKFNVLHRHPLNEVCHTTPAVALGRLFIHTEKHLFSLGGAKKVAAK